MLTPWEVKGKIDYDKLIEEFGVKLITRELIGRLGDHYMLNRGIFYAHRDLDVLLDRYSKGEKFFLYTGRGPSGITHLGHLLPWFFVKYLQDKFDLELYFQLTDDEKFLFREGLNLEEVRRLSYDNALDVIALGFKKGKTKIFIDTENSQLLYNLGIRIAKQVNYSTVKAVFGLNDQSSIGQIFFTAIQSAPCFIDSIKKGRNTPCLIPCGIDQDPHFRITRDVAPKLGFYKPAGIYCKLLPGLDGSDKMSSSIPDSCIFTSDKEGDVRRKIKNAFTGGATSVNEQRAEGGRPEICTVYKYFYFLFEDASVDERALKCREGSILCGECKSELIERINSFLGEFNQRRERAKDVLEEFVVKL